MHKWNWSDCRYCCNCPWLKTSTIVSANSLSLLSFISPTTSTTSFLLLLLYAVYFSLSNNWFLTIFQFVLCCYFMSCIFSFTQTHTYSTYNSLPVSINISIGQVQSLSITSFHITHNSKQQQQLCPTHKSTSSKLNFFTQINNQQFHPNCLLFLVCMLFILNPTHTTTHTITSSSHWNT